MELLGALIILVCFYAALIGVLHLIAGIMSITLKKARELRKRNYNYKPGPAKEISWSFILSPFISAAIMAALIILTQ